MTFFVDNELADARLGLAVIFFRGARDFPSENRFSRAPGEMHKYFLDGKIFARGAIRRGKYFFPREVLREKISAKTRKNARRENDFTRRPQKITSSLIWQALHRGGSIHRDDARAGVLAQHFCKKTWMGGQGTTDH